MSLLHSSHIYESFFTINNIFLYQQLIRGAFPIGVCKYLFRPEFNWIKRCTSSHHLWTVSVYIQWRASSISLELFHITSWLLTQCLQDSFSIMDEWRYFPLASAPPFFHLSSNICLYVSLHDSCSYQISKKWRRTRFIFEHQFVSWDGKWSRNYAVD